MDTESIMDDYDNTLGWDESSKLSIALEFIYSNGHADAFAAHVENRANEELETAAEFEDDEE